MDNYYCSFSQKDGEISSVRVYLTENQEDSVLISKMYITQLKKYTEISKEDTSLFYIIARAIQLRKENSKKIAHSVQKYELGNKHYPFYVKFISKLMELLKLVPIELVEMYFSSDAKVQDLDIFLNKKECDEMAIYLREEQTFFDYDDYFEDDSNNYFII